MIKKTLLLLLLTISISCSNDLKEEIGEEGFILGYEYETLLDKEIIQFSDFQNTILHKQKIKNNYLKNLLSLKSETKEISTNEIVIHIDTSKITKFVHPGYTTYTFKVVTTVPGGFDNLILVETETSLKEYVVKYRPSNGWTKSSGLPYTGVIEYLSERNLTKNSACVLTIEPIYSNCSAGNNHPPDGSGGSCTVGYGSLIGYNIYEGSGCSSGGGTGGDSGGDGSGPGDGSGTIGGGGGSGGDGPYYGEIPTDIDDDPIVLSAGMVFNYLGTSSVEYNWIMNSGNYEDQQTVAEYLINKNHSTEAKAFAKVAIQTKMRGGEVDFKTELAIEITETLLFQSKTSLKKIKDDIVSTGELTQIIDKFRPTNPVLHLEWGIFSNLNWRNTGRTILNESLNTAFIDINENSLQKVTNIVMVKTIAHEIVHAELFRKLKEIVNQTGMISLSEYEALRGNYPGIAHYAMAYGDLIINQDGNRVVTWGLTPNYHQAHHNQMASFYRETLIKTMKAYDLMHNIHRGSNSEEFYNAMSWAGLRTYSEDEGITQYYDAWLEFKNLIDINENHIPIGQRTYDRYNAIITQEYNNSGINYLD